MARVRLDQQVNNDGEITTCAALLDAGKAYVERIERFGKNEVTKYFCSMVADPMSGWEIGQKAYESRAAKGQDCIPDAPASNDAPTPPALVVNGTWNGECFEIDVNYDTMIAMRAVYNEIHCEAHDASGAQWRVWYDVRDVPIKRAYIPSREEHEGIYGKYYRLYWRCPVCGAARGEIAAVISYDGSRRLHCDGWENPCGHIDKYADVRAEAADNGLNA